MMKFNPNYWIKFSLINLLLVTCLGVLMRYKIGFDFPYLTQKNILHAHSHFAFMGWVSHTIYVLMIRFVLKNTTQNNLKQYKWLLVSTLICSYGMLITFFFSGYSPISIVFTTLIVFLNCFWAYYLFDDFNRIESRLPSIIWFKSALIFNVLSFAGTFGLAFMMSGKHYNEYWYLASIYFYLHFQYNGFFTFSCFGLAINQLPEFAPAYKYRKLIYTLFVSSCIITFFLSTLWANLPMWLYILVVLASFAQVIGWYLFARDVWLALKAGTKLSSFAKFMFFYASIAFTIKLLLQLGSTIPKLSTLAYGFRPIIIAYLHLILLGVISVFLLGYLYTTHIIQTHKQAKTAISVFLVGIFLNELALGVQGLASFSYFPIAYINEILFGIAILLFLGVAFVLTTQLRKQVTI